MVAPRWADDSTANGMRIAYCKRVLAGQSYVPYAGELRKWYPLYARSGTRQDVMAMEEIDIEVPANEIEAFCKRWDIVELSVFGSALRDDFTSESDIDLLVSYADSARHSLFALVRMRNELESIFGREVDIVSRRMVEVSRNRIRRDAILSSARIVYAAG